MLEGLIDVSWNEEKNLYILTLAPHTVGEERRVVFNVSYGNSVKEHGEMHHNIMRSQVRPSEGRACDFMIRRACLRFHDVVVSHANPRPFRLAIKSARR